MRSRCGCCWFRSSIGLVESLALAVLLGGLTLLTSCFSGAAEHPGAVYDPANRGSSGEFVIAGTGGSGQATLPNEMKYTDPMYPNRSEPIREWVYRYRWTGTDGKSHVSDWKTLGVNPDGSAVCRLTVRPSEVPELIGAWNAGSPVNCICETSARFKTLDGKNERFQDIPIPVWVNPGY